MYLKAAGCLVVIFSASGYGYCRGLEYKKHVEELEYLNRLIGQIKGEISYTRAPLGDVFSKVGRRIREPYRSWLLALSAGMEYRGSTMLADLWKRITEEHLTNLYLDQEEQRELKNLGNQMGYLDIRMQEEVLAWYCGRLDEKRKMLSEELAQKRRLCSCLGVMGGIFLAIVLI